MDSVVSDPDGGSDYNRQIAHSCLVGEGLEMICDKRAKLSDMSSMNATQWDGCLNRAIRQVGA